MSEIPEDVIKAATDFQDMVDGDPKAYTAFDVAVLAILAERDRCANIAQSGDINDFGYGYIETESDMRDAISEAIRRR